MAESVKQELQRKLDGSTEALNDVLNYLKRYNEAKEILTKRCDDLQTAIDSLKDDEETQAPSPNNV